MLSYSHWKAPLFDSFLFTKMDLFVVMILFIHIMMSQVILETIYRRMYFQQNVIFSQWVNLDPEINSYVFLFFGFSDFFHNHQKVQYFPIFAAKMKSNLRRCCFQISICTFSQLILKKIKLMLALIKGQSFSFSFFRGHLLCPRYACSIYVLLIQ